MQSYRVFLPINIQVEGSEFQDISQTSFVHLYHLYHCTFVSFIADIICTLQLTGQYRELKREAMYVQ